MQGNYNRNINEVKCYTYLQPNQYNYTYQYQYPNDISNKEENPPKFPNSINSKTTIIPKKNKTNTKGMKNEIKINQNQSQSQTQLKDNDNLWQINNKTEIKIQKTKKAKESNREKYQKKEEERNKDNNYNKIQILNEEKKEIKHFIPSIIPRIENHLYPDITIVKFGAK